MASALTLATVAGILFVWGYTPQPVSAPLPGVQVSAAKSQRPTGPDRIIIPAAGGVVSPDTMDASMLFIPSLGVYAPVSGVRAAGGVVEPPFPVSTVGWVTTTSKPGSGQGSILITGHVSDGNVHGALYPLSTAVAGARAYLTDAAGSKTAWQLSTLSTYVKADLPADVWSTVGDERLVVVTCGGAPVVVRGADGVRRFSYEDNVVAVFVRLQD